MIAFEVAIDGQRACTAGVGELGIISFLSSWVRRPSHNAASGEPIPGRFEEELTLEVAGLVHDGDGASVHLKWLQQPLRVGQQITFTVVDTKEADPPQTRKREDPSWAERRKREYYARLKAEYGEA
jgi:hypothetical protein